MAMFELTPEQISIVAEQLSIAQDWCDAGEKGIVAAQVFRNAKNPDEVWCAAGFILPEKADKLIAILGGKD